MMDDKGRVWVTSNIRKLRTRTSARRDRTTLSPSISRCPQRGNKPPYMIPNKEIQAAGHLLSTHHLQMGYDKDNTMFFSTPGGQAFGWVKQKVLDDTGDAKKAQGWCPAYLIRMATERLIRRPISASPSTATGSLSILSTTRSGWLTPGPPRDICFALVSVPIRRAHVCPKIYEPPFDNPKMPGVFGFGPRGIDVDRNGVVWTALSGSSHLASFDRRKCKVTNGPTATGQHCPEGWTLYTSPGPKMKGVTDDSSADFEYYNWVDQFNTLGLGENFPSSTAPARIRWKHLFRAQRHGSSCAFRIRWAFTLGD